MRLGDIFKAIRIIGTAGSNRLQGEFLGGILTSGQVGQVPVTQAYSAAPVMDAALGQIFIMTVTDAVAFVIGAPVNPPTTGFAQFIVLTIKNGSGGAHGAGSFNAVFKTSAAVPAIANATNRSFCFRWDGTNWVEQWRTAADVAN